MTLRIDVACAANAAFVLIASDVTAARAAVQICHVMPAQCFYGPDGGWYYTLRRNGVSGSVVLPRHRAVRRHIRAAWGRRATDGKAKGRSWGHANETAASESALSACN